IHNLIGTLAIIRLFSSLERGLGYAEETEGICFAISAGICWGSMGVAAQVLMEDSGFVVGDLVAGRLLGAGALLLMFEHFFMRRSLLKYFSQPGVAKDILLYGVLVLLTQLTFFL